MLPNHLQTTNAPKDDAVHTSVLQNTGFASLRDSFSEYIGCSVRSGCFRCHVIGSWSGQQGRSLVKGTGLDCESSWHSMKLGGTTKREWMAYHSGDRSVLDDQIESYWGPGIQSDPHWSIGGTTGEELSTSSRLRIGGVESGRQLPCLIWLVSVSQF